jgi:ATP-dependent RNA helicase DeaD
LEHQKPIVYVCPPAGWAVAPLFDALPRTDTPGLETLILAPETGDVLDAAAALRATTAPGLVHPLTGLARTERLLRADAVKTLVATPADARYLLGRSALKGEQLSRVAVLWPESLLALGGSDDLETILADTGNAQRIIATANVDPLSDFLERHARRAPTAVLSDYREGGVGSTRYAIVEPPGRAQAARVALDILAPKRTLVWDPTTPGLREAIAAPDVESIAETDAKDADLVIAADLPSAEALAGFCGLGGQVLVFLRAPQLPYLERISGLVKPLRLPGYTDRARSAAGKLREELRRTLAGTDLTTALLAIEPLLDEYDPALVAAAALTTKGDAPTTPEATEPAPSTDGATWTRIYVTVGRRDGASPGQVLGAVLRAAELQRPDVGRIDLKDSFALVEVRPGVAEHTVRCLSGEKIGGRRVTARMDRHESSGKSRSSTPDR